MNEKNYSLSDLLDDARDYLKTEYDLLDVQYPDDCVHEVADSFVPIYNYDLLQYAANCLDLAVDEPELGPAFDGSPTPVNIIAANIYEAVSNYLYGELDDILAELEQENKCPNCGEFGNFPDGGTDRDNVICNGCNCLWNKETKTIIKS